MSISSFHVLSLSLPLSFFLSLSSSLSLSPSFSLSLSPLFLFLSLSFSLSLSLSLFISRILCVILNFRMLPLAVEIDSASLELLYSDLLCDLKVIGREQSIASNTPDEWIESFNKQVLNPCDKRLVDIHRSMVAAKAAQMYIEKLIIHPMKISLTFIQTLYPRKRDKDSVPSRAYNIMMSLAGVDRMPIKLKSFEVDDVMESTSSLADLITQKTLHDVQLQLASIAGNKFF